MLPGYVMDELQCDGIIDELLQKNAGKGVAVANAISMIKEIADDVAERNDEDGVAKYIEKAIKRI